MKRAYIFYRKFYDFDNEFVTIGGIQTYIRQLCSICQELGMTTHVVQMGKLDKEKILDKSVFIQYKAKDKKEFEKAIKHKLLPSVDMEKDLFIFASDQMIFHNIKFKKSIAIQHGIFWDTPSESPRKLLTTLYFKTKRAYLNIKLIKLAQEIVCVDYNFLNWYRSQVEYFINNINVIPNFAEIAQKNEKPNDTIKIIFARRLYDYRGTRLFVDAVKRLLAEKTNISVTIAGSGPDEQLMRKGLEGFSNVEFITYKSNESLSIHADKHIAIVPTIGSEGTSLSLLEAMSSQCAVICTNVGGMTNIVIDGYNGLMINPQEDELYNAMLKLIENKKLRDTLADRGYETVKEAFSFDKWKDKWIRLIKALIKE